MESESYGLIRYYLTKAALAGDWDSFTYMIRNSKYLYTYEFPSFVVALARINGNTRLA